MKTIVFAIVLLSFNVSAGTDIGKVYGNNTYVAYIGSGNEIFLRKGSSSFAFKCATGFKSKGSYVMAPDGSSLKGKNSVLTAIQRRLVKGKYKGNGCK